MCNSTVVNLFRKATAHCIYFAICWLSINYCSAQLPACNTFTRVVGANQSFEINPARTNITGVCIGCSIDSTDNVLDGIATQSAHFNMLLSVGTTARLAVRDYANITYPAGTFVGFEVSGTALLDLSIFSNITVNNYNNGNPAGTANGASLIQLNSNLIFGNGKRVIGFYAPSSFDEVELEMTSVIGLQLGDVKVHDFVMINFCSGANLSCNALTPMRNPSQPIYIDGANTTISSLVCALCGISNTENIIDNNASTYASMILNTGVLNNSTIGIGFAIDTLTANTFIGFDVETNELLSANVLNNITISLYKDNVPVGSGATNVQLVGATSDILNGRSRQILGIVAPAAFNKAVLKFEQLVAASPLGEIKIFDVLTQKPCKASLDCNSAYLLTPNKFPVVINGDRTGVNGLASVAATIQHPWNAVTESNTDFTVIRNVATVAASVNLSVLDPVGTYPAGTQTGFIIETDPAFILNAALLNKMTITTRLNGGIQNTYSGSNLLNLSLLGGLVTISTGNQYSVGFKTTLPFDEITLSVDPLVGVGLLNDQIKVYGAFIDTRTSDFTDPIIQCNYTMPDFNVGIINNPIAGNVNTNDNVATGTTYGTAVTVTTNPTTTIPAVNADGTYTFLESVPGLYKFNVPVCTDSTKLVCKNELLTITLINVNTNAINPPIANTDLAQTKMGTAVQINVLNNDKTVTPGSNLVLSSLTIADVNGASAGNSANGGIAIANPTTGMVSYTPPVDFYGKDTIQYQISDDQITPMSATAFAVIDVVTDETTFNSVIASDDFIITNSGVATSTNTLINDSDPQGNAISSTPFSISNTSMNLTLNTNGNLTVAPDITYFGDTAIVQTTCDNANPSACANASIYLLVVPGSFPLPLDNLYNFKAKVDQCQTSLSWNTEPTNDVVKFMVNYSYDSKSWKSIGEIVAINGESKYTYNHIDNSNSEKNYYQLQLHFKNGETKWSNILALNNQCTSGASVAVYPNPAKNNLTVKSSDGQMIEQIFITDVTGKVLWHQQNIDQALFEINTSSLINGVYFIKMQGYNWVQTKSFNINK